jgi:site-specific DNA-adenine methylase
MLIKAPLSYYGGKSKIAHLYPAPSHSLIVEPFAGSAAYAWLHRRDGLGNRRDVWLNDLDARTHSIWKFLVSPEALDAVELYVPDSVTAGMKVSDIIPSEFPGLIELCRAEANQGTQGAKGVHDQVTSMGAKCWKVKRKLREVIPEVAHWQITNHDYKDIINVEATWFIDPPYSNPAGSRYRTNDIDYEHLGWWCLNRKGQVIVCENYNADWLPFERFNHDRVSIRSRYQKANAQEVMFTRSTPLPDTPVSKTTEEPLTDVASCATKKTVPGSTSTLNDL